MKGKLSENFAGLKKGSEIILENKKELGFYATLDYKGSKIIIPQNSELIELDLKLEERVNCIDDVYKELKRIKPTLDNYLHIPEYKRERALNTQYIDDIAELFNEGWKPDFGNRQQTKYYPYFIKNDSGWSLYGVFYYSFYSDLSSGFYFKDRTIATLCANKFLIIYSKVLE